MKIDKPNLLLIAFSLILPAIVFCQQYTSNKEGIHFYEARSWYWQYEGKPILLKGGSNDDNHYQWTGKKLTDHLDLLASVGGNYIRNTMSDRDPGNVYAFKKMSNGKYDLNQWNEEYWNRLTFFLKETKARDIIVQLTLWDKFDIGTSVWKQHPWSAEANVNIKSDQWNGSLDFYSTADRKAESELKFQKQYIDKLLSVTLQFDHILYNINNESSESGGWENYWAKYIKEIATTSNKKIYVTNMQLSAFNAIRHVMSNPELFDFVDISQNNQDSKGARGRAHWDYLMFIRKKIASFGPVPINNVKIYGGSDGMTNFSAGSETEAIDRFWRNVFGGCASVRFHRPSVPEKLWGSGLNERVQTNLKAMDMVLEELDLFSCIPHNDLISSFTPVSSMMEAYATANIGHQYAIYFPQGRYKVNLDPWVYADQLKLKWLDIETLKWSEPEIVDVKWAGGKNDWGFQGSVTLETPSNRQCVAFLEIVK